jgi:hypothetical protein
VQAQDHVAVKWAVGLRFSEDVTVADVERAIADGTIVRTHALRPTWQLVHAQDVRWMLRLVAPRLVKRLATRHRQLGLDEATLLRSHRALERERSAMAGTSRATSSRRSSAARESRPSISASPTCSHARSSRR